MRPPSSTRAQCRSSTKGTHELMIRQSEQRQVMTATLRDYLGTRCPCCAKDILQHAETTNRMPGAELAWCPACNAHLTVEQLSTRRKGNSSLFAKLFGKPQRG